MMSDLLQDRSTAEDYLERASGSRDESLWDKSVNRAVALYEQDRDLGQQSERNQTPVQQQQTAAQRRYEAKLQSTAGASGYRTGPQQSTAHDRYKASRQQSKEKKAKEEDEQQPKTRYIQDASDY